MEGSDPLLLNRKRPFGGPEGSGGFRGTIQAPPHFRDFPSECRIAFSADFCYIDHAENTPDHPALNKEEHSMKYVCNICGWVYDEAETGVKWEDLPEDFVCELCGAGKDEFSPEE